VSARLGVPKTYKLFIGGKFPRSESGHTYEVSGHKGNFLANVAKASRKDARDAVVAARAAHPGFSALTAYNRGQILYRVAEVLEGRRDQFVQEIRESEGVSTAQATQQVDRSIDTWVWYAGFADKYQQIVGNGNPVSGPYFNLSVPEPTGVVVALATQEPKGHSLLGFTSVVAPIVVSGNSVVALTHHSQPRSALSLAEVLATSDVPGGVVNILSGNPGEIMPWLASHADVNAMDLAGGSAADWVAWQKAAAGTLKRVLSPVEGIPSRSLDRITAFTETKTVWHTKAMG
jgi:acyl-CoA reductase-like NAD-dependent aldehyde dehydrogenase